MKKQLLLVAASMLLLSACSSAPAVTSEITTKPAQDNGKVFKIGITQFAEQDSYDTARQGFVAALKDNGLTDGKNIKLDVENAEGDLKKNDAIAKKFVEDDRDDLILAISTQSAQAAVKETKIIPVLFTAVSDPFGAKLVDNVSPTGNVTGSTDSHPEAIRTAMQSVRDFFPSAERVGVIYNAEDPNSKSILNDLDYSTQEFQLAPVKIGVHKSSDVSNAANFLVGKIDAFYIPNDTLVNSVLDAVIKVANDKKIPLFVGNSDGVKRGAFAGYGIDYYQLGYKTGKMAAQILKDGAKPSDMQVKIPDNLKLTLNLKAAAAEGIEVTPRMKADAVIIGQ